MSKARMEELTREIVTQLGVWVRTRGHQWKGKTESQLVDLMTAYVWGYLAAREGGSEEMVSTMTTAVYRAIVVAGEAS